MTSRDEDRSRALALLGLLSAGKSKRSAPYSQDNSQIFSTPAGEKPTSDEIWNWMADEVSENRAKEIRSHIAFDTECYAIWQQLHLAKTELTEESNTTKELSDQSANHLRLPTNISDPDAQPANTSGTHTENLDPNKSKNITKSNTKQFSNWILLATAACVISVLLFRTLSPPQGEIDFWQDWQVAKSATARIYSDDEQKTLRRILGGMEIQLTKEEIPAIGPQGQSLLFTDCDNNLACKQQESKLNTLGSELIKARLECLKPTCSWSNSSADESHHTNSINIRYYHC